MTEQEMKQAAINLIKRGALFLQEQGEDVSTIFDEVRYIERTMNNKGLTAPEPITTRCVEIDPTKWGKHA